MIRTFAKKIVPYHDHARKLEMDIIMANIPANSLMLDGGIGDGTFSIPLSRRFKIIGLDIDPIELGRARKLGTVSVVCDLARIPIRDNCIDFVLSNSVMEHVPNVADAMNEYGRVAKIGATMILTLPGLDKGMVKRIGRVMYQIHNYLTASEWWDLIENAGFRMKKEVRYQHREIHNLYILSCIFLPLIVVARLCLYLIKKLPENGVHVCLISEKI